MDSYTNHPNVRGSIMTVHLALSIWRPELDQMKPIVRNKQIVVPCNDARYLKAIAHLQAWVVAERPWSLRPMFHTGGGLRTFAQFSLLTGHPGRHPALHGSELPRQHRRDSGSRPLRGIPG